jgi:hypothetical protein
MLTWWKLYGNHRCPKDLATMVENILEFLPVAYVPEESFFSRAAFW